MIGQDDAPQIQRALSDPHRVTIKFDLDGEALGLRNHEHVANDLEAIVLWAMSKHGYRLTDIVGLRVKVRDA